MKKIIITGVNSYIGKNLADLLKDKFDQYEVKLMSVKNEEWEKQDFSKYDVIVHVAGIVHQKKNKVSQEQYIKVNAELTRELAVKAKNEGVKQFIFLSTMSIYGEIGSLERKISIDENTLPSPQNFYGESKLLGEKYLLDLEQDNFKIYILRPPMVYGENCPGNYNLLKKLSMYIPVFPLVDNERSAINVKVLVREIKKGIDFHLQGISLPQDDSYMNTSELVKKMAFENGRSIYLSKVLGVMVKVFLKKTPVVKKVFGNLTYTK
ncbi:MULTISPECIES: NAD-dependent epimerase/dehydratase family protein [Priestia]|uniref:NAD-dependent epimerase/dehydratase family protein n=1 Tax=Priestia aryabhattai TaxID=412384 RepID=A0ABD7WYQ6_PRIAR|nr:NAD-dependent epimerase/dehydratase family protein [Priestia aryabhattai]WEA45470.1 NAD-dependent epimerase/dehydratase family protein [Priestia aryabhattai]